MVLQDQRRIRHYSIFLLMSISVLNMFTTGIGVEADNIHCQLHQSKCSQSVNQPQSLSTTAQEIDWQNVDEDEDKTPTPIQVNMAEQPKPNSAPTKLLKGEVTYVVPRGTPIKLKLASVPTHVIKMMNRDLDGNLYPAKLGQHITAKTTEDIYVDENKVIPEGTIFCGQVSKILPPRRLSRPGSLVLSFDQLVTPDGRRFAFKAEADNFKPSTSKSKAKGLGIIAAHAAGGAVVGALVAYRVFGMEKTISMHGYNIAGGAAAGALIATGYAVMKKGPEATLEPGDDLNMAIDTELLMPIASNVEAKTMPDEIPGLKMQIEKKKIVSDGLGAHIVTVDVKAINESDEELSSIDLFLEDSNGERHPLCSSPEENSQFLFHLEPHSERHLHLSFITQYPKLKQRLVWLDHHTKLAVARQNVQ